MIVCLSIDHHGKPHKLDDRGAVGHALCETDYTSRYAWVCERELRKSGAKVMVISSGHYKDRWALADSVGADCYISLHMNAGGGDRGEVFFDYRTSPDNGIALAKRIQQSLDDRVPWYVEVKPACESDRAYRCIEGLKTVGIVYEPAFIDSPRGPLMDHRSSMGKALADGIGVWAWRRRP